MASLGDWLEPLTGLSLTGLSLTDGLILGLALLLALSFEFVNGFHDTANAVATVIYTQSLSPTVAVIWSGLWNLIGVLTSTGAVAFSIVSLLPAGLVLDVGSGAGFAMIVALLSAAILWNLSTWFLGLPVSSSHTLIGSILGIGLANRLLHPGEATAGVNWSIAQPVGLSLLVSPLIGFCGAGLLLLLLKWLLPQPDLYQAPTDSAPPPFWIRSLLVLTCTGISFAHGSNDGQKGMGLIMLILVGLLPGFYALNPLLSAADLAQLSASAQQISLSRSVEPALALTQQDILQKLAGKTALAELTLPERAELRRELDWLAELLTQRERSGQILSGPERQQEHESEHQAVIAYRQALQTATQFIPIWVKGAVALALGLGTMIGWKRIVVTVGEKIGKDHLTYGQGAAAELVAMGTILAADTVGLPVSTTQILSSGIAGTMAANGSGIQSRTVTNLLLAWILTLPICMGLSGLLFAIGLAIVARLG